MISIFYLICLVIATGNLLYLTQKKNQYVDKYYWTMTVLIPIIILGYWLKTTVHVPEAAVVAMCFIYLDSTVFLVLIMLSTLKSVNVTVPRWIKLGIYGITSIHLYIVWLNKDTTLYYSSVSVEQTSYGTATVMTAGPLKIAHYIYLGVIFFVLVGTIIYGFMKKGTFSRKTLMSYAVMSIFGILVYAIEIILDVDFSMMPAIYALASCMFAFTYDHIQGHDIYYLIGQRQDQNGNIGFCAMDRNRCLLGHNTKFAEMIPDVLNVVIDEPVSQEYEFAKKLNDALDFFDDKGEYSSKMRIGNKILYMIITSFSINEDRPDGYLLEVKDVTEEQKRLDVVKKYNERLEQEVNQKTEHILDIQNSVVIGLANMVEDQDDSTGGHVKRTSDVIQILIDEIRKQGVYRIEAAQAKNIVRAAAMHDLGKISIDKSILCKPGRLTGEEFVVMRTHASKSGEIVRIILDGVEENDFIEVAYNIARYHHERWDGKGYPEGLIGELIPVEARIMAVADVYDALVTKRCYKEAMSFEEATKIMKECMGSQFDPAMRPVFVACREKLESYYSQNTY